MTTAVLSYVDILTKDWSETVKDGHAAEHLHTPGQMLHKLGLIISLSVSKKLDAAFYLPQFQHQKGVRRSDQHFVWSILGAFSGTQKETWRTSVIEVFLVEQESDETFFWNSASVQRNLQATCWLVYQTIFERRSNERQVSLRSLAKGIHEKSCDFNFSSLEHNIYLGSSHCAMVSTNQSCIN